MISDEPVEWPPAPNKAGKRLFWVRGHPELSDGIYTAVALKNRYFDPNQEFAKDVIWATIGCESCMKKATESGADQSIVFWR